MKKYNVLLKSEISKTYRAQRAADSLDIDTEKKSIHELNIECDIETDYNVGLIIGASGSGKTTLAKHIFGNDVFKTYLNESKSLIDQFPESYTYDECSSIIAGVGLTSVPCWIRPAYTLSNGQKSRAEAALAMCNNENLTVIDEWTSVVDRTVAKVMSHCIQKHARKNKKRIILLSCHYDVVEWLNPDWIIDCNTQQFIDRRLLSNEDRQRKERLQFDIREIDKKSWKYFSKYHYLSEKLPGGKIYTFGIFSGENQIGFQCFANYVPIRKASIPIFHSNRTVIHPDYAGLGLGIRLITETSKIMKQKYNYKIMGKFSSEPVFRSMSKDKNWKLVGISRATTTTTGNIGRKKGYRNKIKTYSFEFIG